MNTLLVQPILNWGKNEKSSPPAVKQVDLQAAGAAGIGYAMTYLSYGGPESQTIRAAAMQRWIVSGGEGTSQLVGQWDGEAVLIPDSATVSGSQAAGPSSAIVAVTARVTAYVPGKNAKAPDAPAAATATADTAYVPVIPPGYRKATAVWLRLLVAVTATEDGRLRVTGPSPVFSGDGLTPIPVGEENDNAAAQDVTRSAVTIMAAYGQGDLDYVVAEGTSLTGMGGALTTETVQDVAVAVGKSDQPRHTRLSVTWQFAGVDALITQTYGLLLSDITSAASINQLGILPPAEPNE